MPSVELPQDYDPTDDPYDLLTPAVETTTGSLIMEPIHDETVLLSKALAVRDALDNELESIALDYIKQNGRPEKDVAREWQAFEYVLGTTPSKGWVTASRCESLLGQTNGLVHLNCNWLQDIARNMIRNRPVEVEVADVTPEMFYNCPPSYAESFTQQQPGLAIGALLKRIQRLDYIRPVIAVDDLPRSTSQFAVGAIQQATTRLAYDALLEHGSITPEDQPGKDFVILPYSAYVGRYPELVERLEDTESGFIARYTDGRVFLRPSDRIRESIAHQFMRQDPGILADGVLLQNADGSPTTAAIQATTFINQINTQFTHLRLHGRPLTDLIGRDTYPVKGERHTSTLLQALDISHPDRDHNIYYDYRHDKAHTVYAFGYLLRREVQNMINSIQSLNPVEHAMKPKDYFEHNYNDEEGIWPEDQQGVAALAAELPIHYAPGEIESATIIGYGPFSYPGLGLAPYMREGEVIDISDLLASNIEFAQEWFSDVASEEQNKTYTRFADQFRLGKKSGKFYKNCEEQFRKAGRLHVAALESLPSDSAQVVVESFVSCSNNIEKYGFYETIRQKARILAWTNRSMMISVHMVESGGWNNSGDHEGIKIPAAKLTRDELQDGYRSAGMRVVRAVPLHADAGLREDYNGMLLVFAKPDTIEKPSSIPR